MMRAEVARRIRDVGVVAVVRALAANDAMRLAEAVNAGGLPVIEITLTVPNALQVIERVVRALDPDALVGAGSVLDKKSARACIAAGARFIVSPVLDLEIIACCQKHEVVAMPGALTPTEVLQASQAGADFVKVFPVAALGGASYVRALKAPMPHLELVPTGGVTLDSVAAFIEAGAAAVGAGSDLLGPEVLRRSGPEGVTAAARAYVAAVRKARGTRQVA